MNRKLTAIALVVAALLTNAGFTALGSIFDYPDVLKDPPGAVLARFRLHQTSVSTWFAVLAASAALFALIAVGVGRLRTDRPMRLAVRIGIAAAVVQTVGLSRWPLLVPGFAHDAASSNATTAADAASHFHTVNVILGTVIGETFGYLLTATWTLLVLASLGRRFAGRAFASLGTVSAVMIVVGVFSPFDLDVIGTLNFAGYVLWSIWLIWLAVAVIRSSETPAPSHVPARSSRSGIAERFDVDSRHASRDHPRRHGWLQPLQPSVPASGEAASGERARKVRTRG